MELVTVIIPFYKNKKWLEESLDSVVNQTYHNLEIIIVNDGSTENINEFEKIDERVHIILKKNGGPASARNSGIVFSKGEYIAFLDSDDFWEPNKIEMQINYMKKNNYVWSHHDYYSINDKNGKIKGVNSAIGGNDKYLSLFKSSRIQTSSLMVKASVLKKEKIFFPVKKRYGQDNIFFLRLAEKYELGHLDKKLSYFRIHGSNAGYRPSVQLHDKGENYKNFLSKNSVLISKFPKQLLLGYRLAYKFDNICAFFIKKMKIRNKKVTEIIYGVFYIVPYILIKTSKV